MKYSELDSQKLKRRSKLVVKYKPKERTLTELATKYLETLAIKERLHNTRRKIWFDMCSATRTFWGWVAGGAQGKWKIILSFDCNSYTTSSVPYSDSVEYIKTIPIEDNPLLLGMPFLPPRLIERRLKGDKSLHPYPCRQDLVDEYNRLETRLGHIAHCEHAFKDLLTKKVLSKYCDNNYNKYYDAFLVLNIAGKDFYFKDVSNKFQMLDQPSIKEIVPPGE